MCVTEREREREREICLPYIKGWRWVSTLAYSGLYLERVFLVRFCWSVGTLQCCVTFRHGLPGDSVGKRSNANGTDPGSITDQEDPLEEDMATHSSALAWGIPWTEKPGGL